MSNVMLLVAPGVALFLLGIVMLVTAGPGAIVVVVGALLMAAGAAVHLATHDDLRP